MHSPAFKSPGLGLNTCSHLLEILNNVISVTVICSWNPMGRWTWTVGDLEPLLTSPASTHPPASGSHSSACFSAPGTAAPQAFHSPSPPCHRFQPALHLGTGTGRGRIRHAPQSTLGCGTVAAVPSLGWQHQGTLSGGVTNYLVYPLPLGLLTCCGLGQEGALWKGEMPHLTSCPRPGT